MNKKTDQKVSSKNDNKKYRTAVGIRIKELRFSLNLTQEEFAKLLDLSNTYISEIEAGNKNPKISFFIKLSKVFGVNLDYIITGTGPLYANRIESKKNPLLMEDVIDIDDLFLLVQNSTLFKNTLLSFSAKFFMDNETIIKKNIKNLKKKKDYSLDKKEKKDRGIEKL